MYVHWPFCRSKCPYCDFNSHVREQVDEARWCAAYLRELASFGEETRGRAVASVFFGGGTPSLMDPATTGAILDAIAGIWTLADDVEVTLEANPTSAEARRFVGFRAAGVNRLSIGVQALDDDSLRFLGREHSADEARDAVILASRSFPRYSFDLIYARPGQDAAAWCDELRAALTLAGDHLAVYQLTIEPGTTFHRQGLAAVGEGLATRMFEETQVLLADAGLPAYEISNHARPGGACRHNLAVWRGADYLGIGPGAHGRLSRECVTEATRQFKAPEKWLAAVEARGWGLAERVRLTAAERIEELLMIGLRLGEGIDRQRFLALTNGVDVTDAVNFAALAQMEEAGFVTLDRRRLAATAAGRQRLNAVLSALLG